MLGPSDVVAATAGIAEANTKEPPITAARRARFGAREVTL
jgi:hypothetical protein